jgi:hypothetical protein
MSYEFQTSIGRFWIRPNPRDAETVILGIDKVTIGFHDSPVLAAAAVYAQETGWERWDTLHPVNGPRDLSEWLEVNP